ncbi:MAG TPA: hypothetical protein VK978_02700 [Candidatus Saccharimonadales bacterium]|nr:hypothetical protein [Candidatus Saccharimonadales bacterium]
MERKPISPFTTPLIRIAKVGLAALLLCVLAGYGWYVAARAQIPCAASAGASWRYAFHDDMGISAWLWMIDLEPNNLETRNRFLGCLTDAGYSVRQAHYAADIIIASKGDETISTSDGLGHVTPGRFYRW